MNLNKIILYGIIIIIICLWYTQVYQQTNFEYVYKNNSYLSDIDRIESDSYYAAEDIVAYTYLNSELEVLIHSDKIRLFDSKMNNVDCESLNFDWYIYIPKYLCVNCLIDLKEVIESNGLVQKTAYMLPHDFDSESLIKEVEIPKANIIYVLGGIELPAIKENKLFIFTLSSDYRIQNVFVPNKTYHGLTEAYFRSVKSKKYNMRSIQEVI